MTPLYIVRGLEKNLPSQITDGNIYLCGDTHVVYVDYQQQRIKLSGEYAEKLRYKLPDGDYQDLTLDSILTESNYEAKIGNADDRESGLMSPEDKVKLDNIDEKAAARNVWFTICEDATASTKILTTLSEDFELKQGNILFVYFPNGNTTENTRFDVDGTGDTGVVIENNIILPKNMITAKDVSCFVYNGESFQLSRGTTASTEHYGLVQLSNEVNSDSETLAATSKAVQTAYKKAQDALPLDGGQMRGTIGLAPAKTKGDSAVDAENSDIDGINGLRFNNVALPSDVGMVFPRGDTGNYDVVRARNGEVYFLQNVPVNDITDEEFRQEITGDYIGQDIDAVPVELEEGFVDGDDIRIVVDSTGLYDGGSIDGEEVKKPESQEQIVYHTGNFNNYADPDNPQPNGTPTPGVKELWARGDHVHPLQTTISGNASTASTLLNPQTIDGALFGGSSPITHFAVCNTPADQNIKVAVFNDERNIFRLENGASIYVLFVNGNSVDGPRLQVQAAAQTIGQPIPMTYKGQPITEKMLQSNSVYHFVYNANSFLLLGELDTDTTYNTATQGQNGLMSAADYIKLQQIQEYAGVESKLKWGSDSTENEIFHLSDKISPVDAALLDDTSHNLISFTDTKNIKVEITRNNEISWEEYTNAEEKIKLVTETMETSDIKVSESLGYKLRITVYGNNCNFESKKICMYIDTGEAANAQYDVYAALKSGSGISSSFTLKQNQIPIAKGEHWSVFQTGDLFGTANSQSSNVYGAYQIVISFTGNTSGGNLYLKKLRIYGINIVKDLTQDGFMKYGVPYKVQPDGTTVFSKNVQITGTVAANVDSTKKLDTMRRFDGIEFDGTGDVMRFGVANKADDGKEGTTTIKVVKNIKNLNRLTDGAIIAVKFEGGAFSLGRVTKLKINDFDAYPIFYQGTNIPYELLKDNETYWFVFRESENDNQGAWCVLGSINTDREVQQYPCSISDADYPILLAPPLIKNQGDVLHTFFTGKTDLTYNGRSRQLQGTITNAIESTYLRSAYINGTQFANAADEDKGLNIITDKWGQSRDITIGDSTQSVNGSTNMIWTHATMGVPKYVNLTGQCQKANKRRSVIALCKIGAEESYSAGRISFHRKSGVDDGPHYVDIVAETYTTQPNTTKRQMSAQIFSTLGPTSSSNKTTGIGINLCTFEYDGVKYGGIEFYFGNSSYEVVEFVGNTNMTVFGKDYYNTDTLAAVTEGGTINSTIKFTSDQDSGIYTNGKLTYNHQEVLTSATYENYVPTITGEGAKGNYKTDNKQWNITVKSATQLETARNIALSNDVTGSADFDGTGNITIKATLKDVTTESSAGESSAVANNTVKFPSINIDTKGRVTQLSQVEQKLPMQTCYCTCSTVAGTATKVCEVKSGHGTFVLMTGAMVAVNFTYTNGANNPMLNVGGTGAKGIKYNGTLISNQSIYKDYAGYAGRTIVYVYDGSAYNFVSWSFDAAHDVVESDGSWNIKAKSANSADKVEASGITGVLSTDHGGTGSSTVDKYPVVESQNMVTSAGIAQAISDGVENAGYNKYVTDGINLTKWTTGTLGWLSSAWGSTVKYGTGKFNSPYVPLGLTKGQSYVFHCQIQNIKSILLVNMENIPITTVFETLIDDERTFAKYINIPEDVTEVSIPFVYQSDTVCDGFIFCGLARDLSATVHVPNSQDDCKIGIIDATLQKGTVASNYDLIPTMLSVEIQQSGWTLDNDLQLYYCLVPIGTLSPTRFVIYKEWEKNFNYDTIVRWGLNDDLKTADYENKIEEIIDNDFKCVGIDGQENGGTKWQVKFTSKNPLDIDIKLVIEYGYIDNQVVIKAEEG